MFKSLFILVPLVLFSFIRGTIVYIEHAISIFEFFLENAQCGSPKFLSGVRGKLMEEIHRPKNGKDSVLLSLLEKNMPNNECLQKIGLFLILHLAVMEHPKSNIEKFYKILLCRKPLLVQLGTKGNSS